MRLTKYFNVNDDKKVTSQLSINRNIGIGNGSVNTGENSGQPVVETRIAYTFPFLGKSSTIGIEGLYGQEKYNTNDGVDEGNYKVSAWAAGLDFSIPLNSKFFLKGEFFRGANLDSLLAGIGQGINTTKEEGIDTIGGWGQLTYKPCGKYSFNVGYGIDRPDKKDLNSDDRFRNQVIFANVFCPIIKDVKFGLEYSNIYTEYVDADKGNDNRVTTSLIYNF